MNDVNKALEYFIHTVKAIFDRHAHQMVKKVRGKPCQWINSDVRKTMSSMKLKDKNFTLCVVYIGVTSSVKTIGKSCSWAIS